VFSTYIDTNDVKLLYGDNDGNVIQIDSSAANDSYAAATANIDFELHTRDLYQPFESGQKLISDKIGVISEASSGAKLYYRTDKHPNRHEDWQTIGEIKERTETFKINDIYYNKLRFKTGGISSTGRFVLRKLELPNAKAVNY